MRWIAPLFAMCSILCAQSTREVSTEAAMGSGPMPGLYKGYLYIVDPYDRLRLFSPDGRFVTSFFVQDHGDERGYVHSVAVDSDGTIAVGWGTRYGPTGIEIHDASGDLIRSIDTGLFFPDDVDFAADHSLWAFGWQRAAEHSQEHAREFPMLRHYSSAGKEIGGYLPRSKFPQGMEPGAAQWQERRIYVMPDFIGLVAFSGNTGTFPITAAKRLPYNWAPASAGNNPFAPNQVEANAVRPADQPKAEQRSPTMPCLARRTRMRAKISTEMLRPK
jgi:hypothetical protein